MEITLRLSLPREAESVPVVRRILKHALEAIRVERQIIGDLELALTEACTNVLDHAGGTEEYEVCAGIDGTNCVIEVIDQGVGFEASDRIMPPDSAEDGRGLLLMKAVSDSVSVIKRPTNGITVRIEKQLVQTG